MWEQIISRFFGILTYVVDVDAEFQLHLDEDE